jgi:hypothetical protein
MFNEVVARRVADAIADPSAKSSRPTFAVFTGDAGNSAGRDQNIESGGIAHQSTTANTPADRDLVHHRWSELVAQPLQEAGTPLFGALGGQDLSQTNACYLLVPGFCRGTREAGNPGPNLPWREAMSQMPAPWGAPKLEDGAENMPARDAGGYSFSPVPASGTEGPSVCTPPVDTPAAGVDEQKAGDQTVPGQGVGSNHADPQCASAGGAHTHYAFDVKREGQDLLRVVVVDTSLKTLSGAAATQNPVEEQLKWLADVLASRPAGERAVVVSETPAYSYGPGAVTDTLTDSTSFEALIARERVDAVISGRLGWNGLFYTIAPGVHSPCPGGAYPAEPPKTGQPPCAPAGSGAPGTPLAPSGAEIADTAKNAGAPLPDTAKDALGSADSLTSAIPNVVAASAGGRFGPRGDSTGPASEGYWHGYSVIRVPTGQDQGPVLVEQRPVLDWVGVSAAKHVLRPHQRVELSGYGREPVGMDVPIRYDEISTPAITHCYDLVWADQDKPWLALLAKDASDQQLAAAGTGCHARFLDSGATSARSDSGAKTNPCDPYVCLDPAIGRLSDDQQGKIEAGSGEHERTFALAMLSVGKLSATYPLVFEPRPSFTNQSIPPGPPPVPVSAPAPSNPPSGQAPPINVAGPPAPPVLPLGAGLSATTPPAVPLPPNNTTPELNLFTSPTSISVAPSLSLFPPAPPVINVAPPTPARPRQEAKKAAVQSSGSEADNPGSSEAQNLGGDLAGSSDTTPGSAMTRHENSATRRDRIAPAQSFTPLAHHNQPSAWARDLQWGGGLTLMALVFAFGWITVRPTPRRRQPEVPAPAEARIRQRR